tara:strand:- start:491 stop:667 length:177 start_codon:yes stop_codon:yes gene_type:complete
VAQEVLDTMEMVGLEVERLVRMVVHLTVLEMSLDQMEVQFTIAMATWFQTVELVGARL